VDWSKLNPKSEEDQKRANRIYQVLFDEIEEKKAVHQIRMTEKVEDNDTLFLQSYEKLQKNLEEGWAKFVAQGGLSKDLH
jgi:hypothetical protein